MYRLHFLAVAAFSTACAGGTGRDAALVATEQYERSKPMLAPPGGTYYGEITIRVTNFRDGFELVDGSVILPLSTAALPISESRNLTVRDSHNTELSATESYTIVREIPAVKIHPPAGDYDGAILVTATTDILNARIEYATGGEFSAYDPEIGIALAQSSDLTLRVCAAAACGPALKASYSITPRAAAPPPAVSVDNTRLLATLAGADFNQLTTTGLSARMDEAKLRVIADGSLLADVSLRRRFLAQRNDTAAANACTTIARYLYILARRISESKLSYTVLPDFADYYIRHIKSGDIVADSDGNFVWIMNGANLVTPYLAQEQLNAFEYHRGSNYPTDFSLLEPIYTGKPTAALMRDSSNAAVGTHTFATVRGDAGFIMLDTYFTAWNGIEARASAGQAWPYAYRFGPAGSRYLHYTYGY